MSERTQPSNQADKSSPLPPSFRLERIASGLVGRIAQSDMVCIKEAGGQVTAASHYSVGLVSHRETRPLLKAYYEQNRGRHLPLEEIIKLTRSPLDNRLTEPQYGLPVFGFKRSEAIYGTKLSVVIGDTEGIMQKERERYLRNLCRVIGVEAEFTGFEADFRVAQVYENGDIAAIEEIVSRCLPDSIDLNSVTSSPQVDDLTLAPGSIQAQTNYDKH
jgi:hypothetical protein